MISEAKKEALARFAEGRRAYKLLDFEAALLSFEAALAADPTDGPSQIYMDRCRQFLANPPPDDWDGVADMKTK